MNTRATTALFALFLVACGYGAKVCAVVDLAQNACTVVKYLDSDGKPQQVQVTPDEARSWAMAMAEKRAHEADGGAK